MWWEQKDKPRPIGTKWWSEWFTDMGSTDSRLRRIEWIVTGHELVERFLNDSSPVLCESLSVSQIEYVEG